MIGKRIKELRAKKGATQEVMAKTLGVSPQAISKWEQQVTMPDISMLVPIADYFGVSVDYLLRETNEVDVDPDKFVELISDKELRRWRCAVKNISDVEIEEVRIKAYFFDKNGKQIDSNERIVYDLEPNTVSSELLLTGLAEKVVSVKTVIKSIMFTNGLKWSRRN